MCFRLENVACPEPCTTPDKIEAAFTTHDVDTSVLVPTGKKVSRPLLLELFIL